MPKSAAGYWLTILLFCSSCVKKIDQPFSPPCDRIVQISAFQYPDNVVYPFMAVFYDSKGRVSSARGEGKINYEFTYFGDHIELKATTFEGELKVYYYYLNAEGRIKSSSVFDNEIKYNKEGFITTMKRPDLKKDLVTGYKQLFFSYQNGNLTEIHDETGEKTYSFEYYENIQQSVAGYNAPLFAGNVISDRPTSFLIEMGFFGQQSHNLLKKANDGSLSVHNIDYQFDHKGRIITQSGIYKFVYQCD